jgi:hypothetical protein
MPLVGNLRDFSLPDFLYLIDRGYKTGSLLLRRADDSALLFFDKGKLVYATKQQRRERLGDMLVRDAKISAQHIEQALQFQQRNNGLSLGQILVQMGAIGKDELQTHIQTQIEETVYSLFAWPDGEFAFEAGVKLGPDEVMVPVPLGVENLIMEGVRRVDEWGRIKDSIPNTDMIVRFLDQPAEKVKSINLTPDEWRVFARINGRDNIKEIATKTNLSEFDACRIIYGFITAGLVDVKQKRPQPSAGELSERAAARQAAQAAPPKKGLVSRIIDRIRGM